MEYLAVKWLHILSSTILFGAGVGSAFHVFIASRRKDLGGIVGATRTVVLADWLFTLPTAILQPATGLWLLHTLGLPLATPWVAWSLGLYVLAGACWIPVVFMQIRMRDIAVQAQERGNALPDGYWRLFRWWVGLGSIAFPAFVVIFWMMVFKRVPWSL
jgi:uncharacterized membrane protein